MVFNMFKGLSRLLSRKSVKTAVPPIVGVQSAEITIDSSKELSVINHQRGIRVAWNNNEGDRVVCVVQSPYIDANTVHERLNGGGYVMPATIDSIRCQYENGDNCTLNQLINRLVQDTMLIRYINTIELADNVVLA